MAGGYGLDSRQVLRVLPNSSNAPRFIVEMQRNLQLGMAGSTLVKSDCVVIVSDDFVVPSSRSILS